MVFVDQSDVMCLFMDCLMVFGDQSDVMCLFYELSNGIWRSPVWCDVFILWIV